MREPPDHRILQGAGALAETLRLGDVAKEGVVTSSAGNHGLGMAHAARVLDVPCRVVVPSGAPQVKVAGIEARGATVVRSPYPGYDATQAWTLEQLSEWGGVFVSPFDAPGVIAGNGGTTALELLEDGPEFEMVVVPVGGGGLIAGVGLTLEAMSPRTRLVGVNAAASPGMWTSRRDGHAHLELESAPTLAEGLEGGVGERTFRLAQRHVDDMVLVREDSIAEAVVEVARRERMLIEGSAAVGVAALLEGQVSARSVCVLLTGSNIDLDRFRGLLEAAGH